MASAVIPGAGRIGTSGGARTGWRMIIRAPRAVFSCAAAPGGVFAGDAGAERQRRSMADGGFPCPSFGQGGPRNSRCCRARSSPRRRRCWRCFDDWPLLSVYHSLRLLAGGFAIGAALGFAAGVAIGWSRPSATGAIRCCASSARCRRPPGCRWRCLYFRRASVPACS